MSSPRGVGGLCLMFSLGSGSGPEGYLTWRMPVGFLVWGEEVQPVAGKGPEFVQQFEFCGCVVAVVKAVAAYEVVVFGLDGGLVVLFCRAVSG